MMPDQNMTLIFRSHHYMGQGPRFKGSQRGAKSSKNEII